MAELGAVVLAAGLSSRMGTRNKLLLPFHGEAILRRVVRACLTVCDLPVRVVTGHEADRIAALLADLPVVLVHNPDYRAGQMTSLVAGLRALPKGCDALIALGDQPLLDAAALRLLIEAHSDATRITIPRRGEARGNPILVPAALIPELLADETNPGCRKFTRDNPGKLRWFDTDQPAFFADVDTAGDLLELTRHDAGAAT